MKVLCGATIIDTNMYTRVFSFNADETDGIRENYNQHGIKILNVSNDGNCDFYSIWIYEQR